MNVGLPTRGNRDIELKNKAGRVESIKAAVEGVLTSAKLFGFKDALSFRGRFAFAEGQTFGRVLAPVARVLSLWVSLGKPMLPTEELKLALAHGSVHPQNAGPKIVSPCNKDRPVLAFTDGAC